MQAKAFLGHHIKIRTPIPPYEETVLKQVHGLAGLVSLLFESFICMQQNGTMAPN